MNSARKGLIAALAFPVALLSGCTPEADGQDRGETWQDPLEAAYSEGHQVGVEMDSLEECNDRYGVSPDRNKNTDLMSTTKEAEFLGCMIGSMDVPDLSFVMNQDLSATEIEDRAYEGYIETDFALDDFVCNVSLKVIARAQEVVVFQEDPWYTRPSSPEHRAFERGCENGLEDR